MLLPGILVIFFYAVDTVTSARVCSQCVHVEFYSKNPNAELPENIVKEPCLKHGKHFTHNEVIECESGVNFCRKVVGKVHMLYKGIAMEASIFSRECGSTGKTEECVQDKDYLPKVIADKGGKNVTVKAEACYCETDYCNTAVHTATVSYTGILLITTAVILAYIVQL